MALVPVKKKPRGRPPGIHWDDAYYVRAYELSRSGMARAAMPAALGIPTELFQQWYRTRPALRDAINSGRGLHENGLSRNNAGESFFEYVEKRLPEDLMAVWKDLDDIFNTENDTAARVEAIFAGRGVRARQHLFIHALVLSNFNATEACRKINVSREALEKWARTDPGFKKLLDHVTTMKKDFVEGALMRGIAAGDASLIQFANRTLNRDRGYDARVVVEHKGIVEVMHQTQDTDDLTDLPIEVQRRALDLARDIRAFRAAGKLPARVVEALPAHEDVIDAK